MFFLSVITVTFIYNAKICAMETKKKRKSLNFKINVSCIRRLYLFTKPSSPIYRKIANGLLLTLPYSHVHFVCLIDSIWQIKHSFCFQTLKKLLISGKCILYVFDTADELNYRKTQWHKNYCFPCTPKFDSRKF